ncbi:MAG: Xaa-Pro peptidase family protein [Pirellulales bacterium]
MTDFGKRRDRLRKMVREEGADALLVTNYVNVSYLTGFTGGDSYLIIGKAGELLISDPRYEIQIGEEAPGLNTFIRSPQVSLPEAAVGQVKSWGATSILVESESITLSLFERLRDALSGTSLGSSSGMVETLRAVKDKTEIDTIRQAVKLAEKLFTSVRATLRGFHTEFETAGEIERLSRALGGTGTSFHPIVAVGERAALPHAVPGVVRIDAAPFVLIDWGVTYRRYRSDLTRVLVTGKIPAKFARIYETVLAAQEAAIAALGPGVMVSEVDRIAREVIAAKGMGERFNHGLGHGIGLDIHEAPRLGKSPDRPLEPGMIVTVEPGVYYPGFGGVRIEDDVLITRDGHEVLSSLPRALDANVVELLD